MEDSNIHLEGIDYPDLRTPEGLERLDDTFVEWLGREAPEQLATLEQIRDSSRELTNKAYSDALLALAPLLERFLARMWQIETPVQELREATLGHEAVYRFKWQFVQKRLKRFRDEGGLPGFEDLDAWLDEALAGAGLDSLDDRELAIARYGLRLLEVSGEQQQSLERLTQWVWQALHTPEGRERTRGWTSLALPLAVDFSDLVPKVPVPGDPAGREEGPPEYARNRYGFTLTDPRMTRREVMDEVHYCIYCHTHEGDFCSIGFPAQKKAPEEGLRVNPLGVTLTGCPLDEKISEMHTLKRDGRSVAALAVAMVDNPMVPATGHRICNDCMKSCIYQKQDAVDIPQIETRVLTDVLELPWGVELYDLLTRWNPLRRRQYRPRRYNGRKVLIAGMGPAGFTLAHHLTMEGCAVVGIDGLKIEPLPKDWIQGPVRNYADITESLATRTTHGFGGVAEYGITVRWDKNFLKLIYLTLARRSTFQVFGGTRLGGTITLEDAWNLGFDHVAIATGAGLPRVLPIPGSLIRGMRQANDVLMALQLTGAAKSASMANLQLRLPAVVIGGGLTAIDTATELQAYYIAQVEKVLRQYETLARTFGEARIREQLDEESAGILEDFIEHGRAVRAAREAAAERGEEPDFRSLVREFGGVTVVYRRGMNDSPAYQRNHEEIAKALEEGIYYAQALQPIRVETDRYGHAQTLICRFQQEGEDGRWYPTESEVSLPARTVLAAAGAVPNTIYEQEYPGTFAMQGTHFAPHRYGPERNEPLGVAEHCKVEETGQFTSYAGPAGERVTFLGDTHPVYHGSVVKAIASARDSYLDIMEAMAHVRRDPDPGEKERRDFAERMEYLLRPEVVAVRRQSPTVVEVVVKAPLAARNFRPGQFFRLQNLETAAREVAGTRLQTEALALTGAGIDPGRGEVSLMVLETGVSSRLCATLRPGDPVVLMGPTGTATEIPENETIMIAAGRRGAAVMATLGPALRAAGNRVLYFAGFRTADEAYQQSALEAGADRIVWCTMSGHPVPNRRPGDLARTGDFLETIRAYGDGLLTDGDDPEPIALADVDRILAIGSEKLLRRIKEGLAGSLKPYFRPDVYAIGSVGSPMQCMLKGVCAQCLQWHVDPATGRRTEAVFSCAMQDQPLEWVDLDNLDSRLGQNRLSEQLSELWLDYLLARGDVDHV